MTSAQRPRRTRADTPGIPQSFHSRTARHDSEAVVAIRAQAMAIVRTALAVDGVRALLLPCYAQGCPIIWAGAQRALWRRVDVPASTDWRTQRIGSQAAARVTQCPRSGIMPAMQTSSIRLLSGRSHPRLHPNGVWPSRGRGRDHVAHEWVARRAGPPVERRTPTASTPFASTADADPRGAASPARRRPTPSRPRIAWSSSTENALAVGWATARVALTFSSVTAYRSLVIPALAQARSGRGHPDWPRRPARSGMPHRAAVPTFSVPRCSELPPTRSPPRSACDHQQ